MILRTAARFTFSSAKIYRTCFSLDSFIHFIISFIPNVQIVTEGPLLIPPTCRFGQSSQTWTWWVMTLIAGGQKLQRWPLRWGCTHCMKAKCKRTHTYNVHTPFKNWLTDSHQNNFTWCVAAVQAQNNGFDSSEPTPRPNPSTWGFFLFYWLYGW